MKIYIFTVLSIIAVLLVEALAQEYRRVCYYTNWAQYRTKPARYVPDNIPVHMCTHLVYAFASMKGNDLVNYEWNDDSTEWMVGMYEKFTNLKQANPKLQTLIGVGGWNFGTKKMTKMLSSATNRKEFIESSINFLRKRNFDGVDLDFEYPAARGSPADDKWRYSLLVQEMNDAFEQESYATKQPKLLLTAAVAAGKSKIDGGYDIPVLARHMDFINLMTYDFHGKWEKKTGHNSPLYGHEHEVGDEQYLNLAFAASYWVDNGMPPVKISVGLPLYGRTFTLKDRKQTGIGAPTKDGGTAGRYTNEKGYLSFYEVCDFLSKGATLYWFEEQQVPYAVLGDQWLAFDNEDSLQIKVEWIKERGFGGVMVWALDLDDFMGSCGRGPYPLMTTVINSLADGTSGGLPLYTVTSHDGLLTPTHGSLSINRPMITDVTNSQLIPQPTNIDHQYTQPTNMDHQYTQPTNLEDRYSHMVDSMMPDFSTLIECGGMDAVTFPHHDDCTRYHQCVAGQLRTFICPPGTRYDAAITACSLMKNGDSCMTSFQMPNQLPALPTDAYPPTTEFNFDDLFNIIPQINQDSSRSVGPSYLLPMLLQEFQASDQRNAMGSHHRPPEYKKGAPGGAVEDLPNSNIVGYMPLSLLHPYNLNQQDKGSQNMTFIDQLFLYYLKSQSGAVPVRNNVIDNEEDTK